MHWYYILAKKPGEKRAMMLASRGRRTNLRVRALQFQEGIIEEELAKLHRDNPDWTFTPKPAGSEKYALRISMASDL